MTIHFEFDFFTPLHFAAINGVFSLEKLCFLLCYCYMMQYTKITTSKLNWTETHTILPTFLESTQEAHMGASCVLPSIASLMGCSVWLFFCL